MHRLGVVADDDDNNKTQAGQFSEIGKFRYVGMYVWLMTAVYYIHT